MNTYPIKVIVDDAFLYNYTPLNTIQTKLVFFKLNESY